MANKYKKALEDVKSLSKLFGAVKEMAEAFEDISDMENQVIASQNKKQKINKELEDLKLVIGSLNKEIESLNLKKSSIHEENEELVKQGQDEKKSILESAVLDRTSMLEEIEFIKKQKESLSQEMKTVSILVDEKKSELLKFENKIEQTKATLRNLVT